MTTHINPEHLANTARMWQVSMPALDCRHIDKLRQRALEDVLANRDFVAENLPAVAEDFGDEVLRRIAHDMSVAESDMDTLGAYGAADRRIPASATSAAARLAHIGTELFQALRPRALRIVDAEIEDALAEAAGILADEREAAA